MTKNTVTRCLHWAVGAGFLGGGSLFAAEEPTAAVDAGHTAWMLVSCALVLLMTPGLACFYGGLVRSKNVLSTMMHSLFCMGLVSMLWFMFGGGMLFGDSVGGFFGWPGDYAFLNGVPDTRVDDGVPFYVLFSFQMMFAIITPALISGAFAERVKFSAFAFFTVMWLALVYCPVAHWVWGTEGGGGILNEKENSWLVAMGLPGAKDFAGGTVVHISAGISALVFALMLGKRTGYPRQPMVPHSLPLAALGAGLLWFGWFGFNGGSGLKADVTAGNAFYVTHLCAACAAFSWAVIEWLHHGKPSILGVITGMVAGLVCITPAAGFVGPVAAFIMGLAVSPICYVFVAFLKVKLGYDDSLDAFGVHGIGGAVGALLTGVFCKAGAGAAQFGSQAISVAITAVYAGVVTAVIVAILKATIGIRADEEEELQGLDTTHHGEAGYNI